MVSGEGDQVRMSVTVFTRVMCRMQWMAAGRAIMISQPNVREYKEVSSYIPQYPSLTLLNALLKDKKVNCFVAYI